MMPKFSEMVGIDPKDMLTWSHEDIRDFCKKFPKLSECMFAELEELGRCVRVHDEYQLN